MALLPSSLATLTRDGWRLYATRCVRLFAYGFLSVELVLYLTATGLSEPQIGTMLTLILLGDTAVSLWITTTADRAGRRRMLIVGAGLMLLAGIAFAVSRDFWVLLIAATIGVISHSGKEVGPFLSIEQAALAQLVPDDQRTEAFAWYNLMGALATALGAFAGGYVTQWMVWLGYDGADIYRPVIVGYALLGIVLAMIFARLSPAIEAPPPPPREPAHSPAWLGLRHSRSIVARLSALFALDAFGGGLVVDSVMAFWLQQRFQASFVTLGSLFLVVNVLAGYSGIVAARLARRIGLVNTMVFTHLPSNVLLVLVPLMPDLAWAMVMLVLRAAIAQMDVPTRQAYTMAVVPPEERSAASGVTTVARSLGAAAATALFGPLFSQAALVNVPFFLGGGVKILYDLLLYKAFTKRPNR